MEKILHSDIPADLVIDANLPGVRPLGQDPWLRVDEAYTAQMAYRRDLLAHQRDKVLWQDVDADAAVDDLYEEVLEQLPEMGFTLDADRITCPDGHCEEHREADKLALLGRLVQEDLCILEKRGAEHVLTAAVLCFPASWTLAEKAGQPLSRIHRPVEEYDDRLTKRVQRLFDGVQIGRPIWRNNYLRYADADLFQPRRESDPTRHQPSKENAQFLRAERQAIVRLPRTGAVLFSIHSYVARAVLA